MGHVSGPRSYGLRVANPTERTLEGKLTTAEARKGGSAKNTDIRWGTRSHGLTLNRAGERVTNRRRSSNLPLKVMESDREPFFW